MDAGPGTDGEDRDLAKKGRKRNEILTAARSEFVHIGYGAPTIRGFAEKTQISTRTIYDYFNDRLGLFNDCIAFSSPAFLQPGLNWDGDSRARAHDAGQWFLPVVTGITGGAAQISNTASVRCAPLAALAPFDYLQLLGAAVLRRRARRPAGRIADLASQSEIVLLSLPMPGIVKSIAAELAGIAADFARHLIQKAGRSRSRRHLGSFGRGDAAQLEPDDLRWNRFAISPQI